MHTVPMYDCTFHSSAGALYRPEYATCQWLFKMLVYLRGDDPLLVWQGAAEFLYSQVTHPCSAQTLPIDRLHARRPELSQLGHSLRLRRRAHLHRAVELGDLMCSAHDYELVDGRLM